jgi:hypothetical protein
MLKYFLTLFIVTCFVFSGCNLHRSGPVAKQMGGKMGKKYHKKSATAKYKKKK